MNVLGGSHGWSPLHVASHSGHYKTVVALVSAGADVFIKNFEGKTPKDTSKGDLAIYKYLTRAEKTHIKLLQKSFSITSLPYSDKSEGLEKDYKDLYNFYEKTDASSIENLIKTESNIGIKADAVYLLSQLKQRKAAKFFLMSINSEESIIKAEALQALESIKENDSKVNHSNNLIGPRLPRSTPLQMSLPTHISAYIEEETRIDTLLII